MKKFKIYTLLLVCLCFVFLPRVKAEEILRLATTTSTYETGLLDYILPPFEKNHNLKVHIISVGTGKAILLGENGDVDIILVHARQEEDKFVKEGYGVNRRDVMYNDFVFLGPKDDPAGIKEADSAAEVLLRIYQKQAVFISRGDDSGTDKKEKVLWQESNIIPKGKWYLESGQGMSATLLMADEKNAYCLVDRATYIVHYKNLRLKLLFESDKDLFNPYGVVAVSPYRYPHVKYELSMALIAWVTSLDCQKMIEEYKKDGHKLYHANAAKL